MDLLKMYFLLKMVIFHCYVSLPEGTVGFISHQPTTNPKPKNWPQMFGFLFQKCVFFKAQSLFFLECSPPTGFLKRARYCTFLVVWWSLGWRNHPTKKCGGLILSFLIPSIPLVEKLPNFSGNKGSWNWELPAKGGPFSKPSSDLLLIHRFWGVFMRSFHRLWYTKTTKRVVLSNTRRPPKLCYSRSKFNMDSQNDAICEEGDTFSNMFHPFLANLFFPQFSGGVNFS